MTKVGAATRIPVCGRWAVLCYATLRYAMLCYAMLPTAPPPHSLDGRYPSRGGETS